MFSSWLLTGPPTPTPKSWILLEQELRTPNDFNINKPVLVEKITTGAKFDLYRSERLLRQSLPSTAGPRSGESCTNAWGRHSEARGTSEGEKTYQHSLLKTIVYSPKCQDKLNAVQVHSFSFRRQNLAIFYSLNEIAQEFGYRNLFVRQTL